VVVIGSETDGKASLLVGLSDELVKGSGLNAVEIIKSIAAEINGGGGGQSFLATAGGKNPEGLRVAVKKALTMIKAKI